jgi:transcriptional regulator with XRE-family HTH domain
MHFGQYVRQTRERLRAGSKDFSVRRVAERVGIEPAYLSKIERGEQQPPSEATVRRIAEDLREDPDVMLAMAGKVSADLREAICKRPQVFAALIRGLKEAPDYAVLRIVREVRDGKW